MTADENDPLVRQLLELVVELDAKNIPVILGGGMSLYLRQKFLSGRTPRYPFDVAARSTADLDLFLSSRLIADARKIVYLRRALTGLGYSALPQARNFQFAKKITVYGQERVVKIDLLAAPPRYADLARVSIRRPRIKPRGAEGIHAYLTDESEGLEFGKLAVDPRFLHPEVRLEHEILFIPSVFNFLILKLHAFEDRKNDEAGDFGRHHAWDIFAAVIRMGEPDWATAKEHRGADAAHAYMKKAVSIARSAFHGRNSMGLLRLRENEAYKRERELYDKYLDLFIQDIAALF